MTSNTAPLWLLISLTMTILVGCGENRHRSGETEPSVTPTALSQSTASPSVSAPSTRPPESLSGTQFDSIAAAQAVYSYPVYVPTAVPTNYHLARVAYCCGGEVGFLILTYQALDGTDALGDKPSFQFLQGVAFARLYVPSQDPRFACMEGTGTVQGRSAVWWKQQIDFNAPQDVCKSENAERKRILHLEWPDAGKTLSVGYEVTSVSLNLDDLVAIANSVLPYGTPSP